ncbi:MAG TPA: GNAT family N-acetyltransferase [Candidatus Binatia bacterium]|nr:GNAT family N-acetyltransferase [Candidatus Binatia bacterium]
MTDADRALYANHRRFLEAQRGALTPCDGFDVIHGDVPAFQIAMLHEAAVAGRARERAAFVFAPPWADPGADVFAGLAYRLTHMSLPASVAQQPAAPQGLTIDRVADEAGLRAFTEAQAAGFAEPGDYGELLAWMWDKNVRAFPLRGQSFYCLRRDGAVVSILLTVDSGDAIGIYAVATPAALRKQGLSSYLLARVCAAAPAGKMVCLQVMRGSDAERLYTKLGFVERFVVNVYKSR